MRESSLNLPWVSENSAKWYKRFFCKTFVCLPFSLKEKSTNKQTTVKGSLRVRYFLVVKMFYSVKYNFQRLDFVGD